MKTLPKEKELIPYTATHPGTLIADELEVRDDINQKDLAHLLDVKPSFLNEIIKGKRSITAESAILLEKSLDIPAELWLKLQAQYDLDCTRIKERNINKVKNIEIWNIIKTYVPVNAFRKLGYLTGNIEEDISMIYAIFKIKDINELISQFATRKFSFYRRSEKLTTNEKNLFSWSALAEYEASMLSTKEFKADCQSQLITELNNCFFNNKEVVNNLKVILTNYGIKLVILNKLEQTPVDGYSFWSENNPAIVLSMRYNRIDYLAFTLFHELGHVFLHLINNKEYKFLDIDDKEKTVYETEADTFASNYLISTQIWKEFKATTSSIDDQSILELSHEYLIHPAIILGRVCYESKNYKIKTDISKSIQ